MTNHLTKRSTELLWKDYKFGTDLDLGDFIQTSPETGAVGSAQPGSLRFCSATMRQTGSERACSTTRNFSFALGFIDGSGLNLSAST